MLYYGDNLPILRNRDSFPSESIDLVYLDPPFNSNQDYNVLFAEQDGTRSAAQIQAFSDSWRWDSAARQIFDETVNQGGKAAEALGAFHSLLGESDMLAYLSMMAPRLVELRRVLRSTGTLYLHCDPTASHYLKILLDSVFKPEHFLNELTWMRTHSHGNVGRNFGSVCDNILVYTKSESYTWNQQFAPFSEDYVRSTFKGLDPDGRRWQSVTLRNPSPRPNLRFEYTASTGVTYHPHPNGWVCNEERLKRYDSEGRLHFPSTPDGALRLKMYLDESPGVRLQNLWTDLPALGALAGERLGFPTQKPQALLERIVATSSNPGETVLDPFCGCGTTVAAAQRLGRRWIGVDITHLAITLIRSRLDDAYGNRVSYVVVGEPADASGAEALALQDRYQFQWWALGKIRARPVAEERKKGADSGIDGKLLFREKEGGPVKTIVIQVKSGKLKLSEVRDFGRVIEREKAPVGVLVTLDEPSRDMRAEATSMGYYRPDWKLSADDKYDRYQIITVRALFEGVQPAYPPFRNVTFKPAPEVEIKSPKRRTRRLGETHNPLLVDAAEHPGDGE